MWKFHDVAQERFWLASAPRDLSETISLLIEQQVKKQKMLRLTLVLVVLSSVLSFQPEHESAVGETLQAVSGITPNRTNYCNPPSSPCLNPPAPAIPQQSSCLGASFSNKPAS